MLVKHWMSKEPITLDENDAMDKAIKVMKQHNIRMLPVTKKGKLVGVVTDRDVKRASASDATTLDVYELMYLLSKLQIKQIMTRDPITVEPDLTVEEAAQLFLEHKISGAPVVDKKGVICGVITSSDVHRLLISLTGVGQRGIQFAFRLADRPGSIKEVADVIRDFGARMMSILTSYDRVPEGFRNVYIRIFNVDRSRLEALKQALRAKATLLYMVDHRENRREIYDY